MLRLELPRFVRVSGLHDHEGRAVLVVETDRFSLQTPDAARLIHYLATLPPKYVKTQAL